jgi:methylase of polypeptide subunit release factors
VNAGGLLTVLPSPDTADAARVYLRPDSLWLLRLIWERDLTGSAAADLGCGSGFLAAALAARYRRVLATELEPVCLTYAGWTLALNRTAARSTGVLATDAGAGLRSGAFDLVVANPPWMPEARAEHRVPGERPQVWAYGGHRGWEIPRRFLDDAVRMLAPGGTAIVLGLATMWADGEAPLADRVASLRAAGYGVDVIASKGLYSVAAAERLCAAVDGLVSARHVATIVRRPAPASPEMSRRANVA